MRITIATFFLAMLSFANHASAGLYSGSSPIGHVAANSFMACIVAEANLILCDVKKPDDWRKPFQVKGQGFTSLVAYNLGMCASDQTGVLCWNDNGTEYIQKFSLKNVRKISVDSSNFCALHEGGLYCGIVYKGKLNSKLPTLENPILFDSDFQGACVIDHSGLQCWKWKLSKELNAPLEADTPRKIEMPKLKNPREFKKLAMNDSFCAIDDDGLKCWGEKPFHISDFKNVRQLNRSPGFFWGITNDGLKIWSSYGDAVDGRLFPILDNPIWLNTSELKCTVDLSGPICRDAIDKDSSSYIPKIKIPGTFANPFFNLDQLSRFFLILDRVSPAAKQKYFKSMASSAAVGSNDSHYLTVRLIGPAVTSIDSSYFQQTLLPSFDKSISEIETELGIHSVQEIPDSLINRQIALSSITAALQITGDFLSPQEQTVIQKLLRLVGQASADSGNTSKIRSALTALKDASPLFEKIKGSTKSAFLAQTLDVATQWLEQLK